MIASEPLDTERDYWKPVPAGHVIIARAGEAVELRPFPHDARLAAE